MSTTRKLIIAFWIFIVIALLWQFYTYNQGLTQAQTDHPVQTQFIFLHTNAPPAATSMAHSNTADIQQVGYVVQPDTPSKGSFTCLVTLKNVGAVKGVGIQISVRPYRGASNYDEDVGHQHPGGLPDEDPISQFNDWLSFPDLDPGQSDTRSVVFIARDDIKPGNNPTPQILFETDKSAPAQAPSASPAPSLPTTPHHSGAND